MMKLHLLKHKVYSAWVAACEIQHRDHSRASGLQDGEFKQTVKAYGDLRCKETWEKAFCALAAVVFVDESEPDYLIQVYLIDSSRREGWRHLLRSVLCHLAAIPRGYRVLCDGLEEIQQYGWTYTDPDPDALSIIQEMVNGKEINIREREQLERLTA